MEKSDDMEKLKADLKQMPRLLVGLVLLALGIYLVKLSSFGLPPWPVLHHGIEVTTGLNLGYNSMIVGAVVLILSIWLFHTKIGVATVLNVLLIGPIIELFRAIYEVPPTTTLHVILIYIPGLLFMTFGRSLYISSNLGQGPRDGLFIGIARTTTVPVKYVKILVELVVLVIGYALGGETGLGTIISLIASGYLVQFFFKVLKYDPKTHHNNSLFDYFK